MDRMLTLANAVDDALLSANERMVPDPEWPTYDYRRVLLENLTVAHMGTRGGWR